MFTAAAIVASAQEFTLPPPAGPLSDEVEYLIVYPDPSDNSRKNTSYRVSQAIRASNIETPPFIHFLFLETYGLQVYEVILLPQRTAALSGRMLRRVSGFSLLSIQTRNHPISALLSSVFNF